jgi:hypothetical protein
MRRHSLGQLPFRKEFRGIWFSSASWTSTRRRGGLDIHLVEQIIWTRNHCSREVLMLIRTLAILVAIFHLVGISNSLAQGRQCSCRVSGLGNEGLGVVFFPDRSPPTLIREGTRVIGLYLSRDGWVRVDNRGREGWISFRFLTNDEDGGQCIRSYCELRPERPPPFPGYHYWNDEEPR